MQQDFASPRANKFTSASLRDICLLQGNWNLANSRIGKHLFTVLLYRYKVFKDRELAII